MRVKNFEVNWDMTGMTKKNLNKHMKHPMNEAATITTGLKTGNVKKFEGVIASVDDNDNIEVITNIYKIFGIVVWVSSKTYNIRDENTTFEYHNWNPK